MRRSWIATIPLCLISLACAARLSCAALPAATRAPAEAAAAAHLSVFGLRGTPATAEASLRKLDGSLAAIAQRYRAPAEAPRVETLHAMNPAARFRLRSPLATPEVLIDAVASGESQALLQRLQSLGLREGSSFLNAVSGWLPIDQLTSAAAAAELRFARASMPRTRSGPVALQGDFVERSDVVRSTYPSLTGAGITVGALSDSFNCYAVYGAAGSGVPASGANGYASNGFTADYATDESTGALGAGVNVLEEATCPSYGQPLQLPFGDEGRAILQIVHAIAPDAALAFHTAVNGETDFANGIVDLQKAGAKIIDDDVGYPDEPFFQDGLIAQAVDQVAAAGVAYFSSAGNDGQNSYENAAPSFTTASGSETLLNFDTSGQTNTTSLPVGIPALFPGEFVIIVLQWDQPYVTGATGSPGSSNSLDLCIASASGTDPLYDDNLNPLSAAPTCTGPSPTGQDPLQMLIVGNPASAAGNTSAETITLTVGLASGAAPKRIKLVVEGDGASVSINQFATNSPTIQGHPTATGAAAVGAAFYFQTPRCDTTPAELESYSSYGGDPILFDTSGNRLSTPEMRQKPQFVGPDGINDTFLGFTLKTSSDPSGTLSTTITQCQTNVSYPNFFGTSAAAPHAAATAALMWQANPAVTASDIVTALQGSALAMGAAPNDGSGYGFIQADAALAQLPPAPPSLTVSPTSITVGQTATLTWSSISTTACSAGGSWSGAQATSGTMQVTPGAAGTLSYSLTCSGLKGSNSSTVSLTVNADPQSSPGTGGGGGGALESATLAALLAGVLGRVWLRSAASDARRTARATRVC